MSLPPFLRPIISCVLRSFVKSTKEEYQCCDKEVPERPKDKSYLSSIFRDSTFCLHCRMWGVDWQSRQGYNVRHGDLRALILGMGQSSLKTPPVWAYQGKTTCESMVGCRRRRQIPGQCC